MTKELIIDIIEWDIENWSKAIDFWTEKIDLKTTKLTCLELGGRRGGLSLWLAINHNEVICSDLNSPQEHASELHEKYSCSEYIEYRSIDATDIPFDNAFDIVVFKSILGGVSRNGKDELKKQTIDEIYKSLKPNGKLLFAENLEASFLHMYIRKRFVKWGSRWNYLKYNEIDEVFDSFDSIQYETVGFLAAFGRTEKQRNLLSKIDHIINPFIPKRHKYIVFGIAEKSAEAAPLDL
ncbi:class I SAM-dependent methyltransferase [Cryomorphaceae bacterium 1068]|nr:class I SAM-dependent methyltransferase [Cryomorphaceae bacterium 1068]